MKKFAAILPNPTATYQNISLRTVSEAKRYMEQYGNGRGEKMKICKTDIETMHIQGRKWFDRTYGNTYHSVYIEVYTKTHVHRCAVGLTYGYGEHYLQTAAELLVHEGLFPYKKNAIHFLKYDLDIPVHISCTDVLKKQLHKAFKLESTPRRCM